jgi:hypothetical protein
VPKEVEGCAALVDENSAITRMNADANLAMRNVLVSVKRLKLCGIASTIRASEAST